MEGIEIKQAIGELGNRIDVKLKAAAEAAEKGLTVASSTKDELNGMVEKFTGMQDQLDRIQTDFSKNLTMTGTVPSFKDQIATGMKESVDFQSFKKGNSKSATLELKVAGTIITPANVVDPAYAPGFYYNPARLQHVRDFISGGSTDSNVVYFVKEVGFTNGAAIVAEGTQKPQSDFTLAATTALVEKIATYHVISTEMLQDVAGITGYISTRLPNKLRYAEDAQLLYGTGAGGQILGIAATGGGTAYVPITSFIGGTPANANKIDVIIEAMNQVRQNEYNPNVVFLNPQDYFQILLTKNSQATYLFPNVYTGSPFMINGVMVVENTAITVGTFIVADLANAAYLWDRQQLTVAFYPQDGVNVQKGLVTVELSERLAMGILRPSALVYGVFANALPPTVTTP